MSKFNFIASDIPLKEVDLTNIRRVSVKEIKQMNPQSKGQVP